MSNTDDYQTKLEVIQAIPNDQIQLPVQPVEVALQEAENLHHWALDDAAQLATVGITQEMIGDIPVRAGALREAQSYWNKDRFSQDEAQREWKVQAPLAYELRDELLHDFRFAFRKDEVLLGRVLAIAEGTGPEDMIQDLNDLSVLGKANTGMFLPVFDVTKLDTAAVKADKMADLLATANGDKAEQNQSKVIRDKAYTHMKELVDEVREAGKYLFWKDELRYRGYTSEYWRKRNRSKNSGDEENTE